MPLLLYPSTCLCVLELSRDGEILRVEKRGKCHSGMKDDAVVIDAIKEEQAFKSAQDALAMEDPQKLDDEGGLKAKYHAKIERSIEIEKL